MSRKIDKNEQEKKNRKSKKMYVKTGGQNAVSSDNTSLHTWFQIKIMQI